MIVFFREIEREGAEQPEQGEEAASRRFVARSFRVFNADQVDGWEEPEALPRPEVEVLANVEHFARATGAVVRHGGSGAYYDIKRDLIVLPDRDRFLGSPTRSPSESYYGVLLHELTHWTGARHRLDREFGRKFGDSAYAMEELIADLGAAFLCADLGISSEPRPDHAAYLALWLDLLKQDARIIFTTARLANLATDYLHGLAASAAGDR